MLTSAEIAAMRTTVATTLQGTAVIQAGTVVSDAGGGGSTTWAASGTVSCHLSPLLRGGEDVTAGRISPEADRILTVPANTAITTDSRVVVGSQTFEVVAVHAPRTWELSRRVEVTERT